MDYSYTHTNNSVENILRICKEITLTSLSCKTIRKDKPHISEEGNSEDKDETKYSKSSLSSIRDEQNIGKWLQAQIIEYNTVIMREGLSLEEENHHQQQNKRKRRDEKSTNNTDSEFYAKQKCKREKQKLQRIKDELFDDTIQKTQQNLLIRRIAMSAASMYTSFPKYQTSAAKRNADVVTDSIEKEEESSLFLRREFVRDRDERVIQVLEKVKEKEKKEICLSRLDKECQDYQEQNSKLWKRLKEFTDNNNMEERNNKPSIKSKVNALMKCAVSDIIIGSGIDWYRDDILREAMEKLEES